MIHERHWSASLECHHLQLWHLAGPLSHTHTHSHFHIQSRIYTHQYYYYTIYGKCHQYRKHFKRSILPYRTTSRNLKSAKIEHVATVILSYSGINRENALAKTIQIDVVTQFTRKKGLEIKMNRNTLLLHNLRQVISFASAVSEK